ncbi:hypothetical protein [Mucilaginibacter sp. PAMB04168]|uniref:hypothetical protein n=1 Tax=Mucilaginibacter sp. PAMB04168 TaxID=3138567 RepID=UPI0031F61A54
MILKNIMILVIITNCWRGSVDSWKRLVINDEVSVEFPKLPVRKEFEDKEMYFYKSLKYAIMVGISKTHFIDYRSKQNIYDKTKVVDLFLDDVVKGKISSGNYTSISVKTLKLGKYIGREVTYSSSTKGINYNQKRFAVFFVINDNLYAFEFWNLQNTENAIDKAHFYNSILIKS